MRDAWSVRAGRSLGEYFFRRGYIEEEDIDAVRYEFEYILSEYVSAALTLLAAAILHRFSDCFLYIIFFVFWRKTMPGFHCSTALRCFILSTILCVQALIVQRMKPIWMTVLELLVLLICAGKRKGIIFPALTGILLLFFRCNDIAGAFASQEFRH